MLVSMMRSAACAVETTGPSFDAGLRCNSIALLHLTNGHGPGSHGVDGGRSDQGGAAFRLPPATTSAARAGSPWNDRSRRWFSLEPQGADAWLMSERQHILAKRRRARAPNAPHRSAGRSA